MAVTTRRVPPFWRRNHGEQMQNNSSHGRMRIWVGWAFRLARMALLLLGLVLLFWLRGALYHRFVRFPREEAAWQTLRAQRQPVATDAGWSEYRGIRSEEHTSELQSLRH